MDNPPNPVDNPPNPEAVGFNADGYDVHGFNAAGFNADGYNADGLNVNGYTAEQQAEYEAFYATRPECNPNQVIRGEDRYWGVIRERNNYLMSFEEADARTMYLGDFNLLPEFNDYLPETCAYTEAQQHKLFLSPPSVL